MNVLLIDQCYNAVKHFFVKRGFFYTGKFTFEIKHEHWSDKRSIEIEA